jgi:hypothetical protein
METPPTIANQPILGIFSIPFVQNQSGEPKIGQFAYDSNFSSKFQELYESNKIQLGQPLAPIQYHETDEKDLQNFKYGVWQPFLKGIISQDRRGHTVVMTGEFWQYFSEPRNRALDKLQGFPTNNPYIENGFKILEFPGGDLVQNAETRQVFKIAGEVGRYFFSIGGYKEVGYPLTNEEWDSEKKIYKQSFTKGIIEYSFNGQETGWTFRFTKQS